MTERYFGIKDGKIYNRFHSKDNFDDIGVDAIVTIEESDLKFINDAFKEDMPFRTVCEHCRTDKPELRKNCAVNCEEHSREQTPQEKPLNREKDK